MAWQDDIIKANRRERWRFYWLGMATGTIFMGFVSAILIKLTESTCG